MIEVSVVICVFNEEGNVVPLVEKLRSSLKNLPYELIFVDDGSTDQTLSRLSLLKEADLKIIEFRRNYGQSAAIAAGIEWARGEWIVTMDGDLQNDPSDIPRMLEMAKSKNLDLLAGIRQNRKDGFILRKIPSKIANFLIRNASGVHLSDYGCTLKVMKADLAKHLGIYGELHRFIPVLADLEGARMDETPVLHHSRQSGNSKYGINRTMRVLSDLLLILYLKKFRHKPMHLFGGWGVLMAMIGTFIMFYLLAEKIAGHDIWGRPILILGTILVVTGLQLIVLGILSEMQLRTYYESQGKKVYRIRKVHSVREETL